MNLAWAKHEIISDYLTPCLAWLEARGAAPMDRLLRELQVGGAGAAGRLWRGAGCWPPREAGAGAPWAACRARRRWGGRLGAQGGCWEAWQGPRTARSVSRRRGAQRLPAAGARQVPSLLHQSFAPARPPGQINKRIAELSAARQAAPEAQDDEALKEAAKQARPFGGFRDWLLGGWQQGDEALM